MEYCLQLGGGGDRKKKEKKREVKSLVLHFQNTFSVALGKLLLYTSVYQPKNCLKKTPLLITFMMCFGVAEWRTLWNVKPLFEITKENITTLQNYSLKDSLLE